MSAPEKICGLRVGIAYNLLGEITSKAAEEDEEAFEKITRAIKLSSGVYRTTYAFRFREVDAVAADLLHDMFSPQQNVQVQDWAASAGLTSVEWARAIFTALPRAQFVASDYYLFLIEARNNRGETYILEPDGTAIQYLKPPFVVPLAGGERSVFITNRLAIAWAMRSANELKQLISSMRFEEIEHCACALPQWRFRRLGLLHPRVRRLQAEDPRFRFVQHDAFVPSSTPCDVLRVMNFYNPRLWSDDALKKGIRSALHSVKIGGLLIIGRSREEQRSRQNDVSIIQRTRDGAAVLQRLGDGSEIEELILELASAAGHSVRLRGTA